MAKTAFKDVVYFNKAGIGVLPGIVLNTRLEQRGLTQEIDEVLTLLYAHPSDAAMAVHSAGEIGDVAFGVKPFREASETFPAVVFGWADNPDAFGDIATPEPPFDVKPDPVNSGSVADHMKKQGTIHGRAPLNELLPLGTYLSDRQTQGPGNEGSVADEDLSKPMNQQGQIVGATAPEDQGGGQIRVQSTDVNPEGAVVDTTETVVDGTVGPPSTDGGALPPHIPTAAEHDAAVERGDVVVVEPAPVEVFADPEGRTIGVTGGDGWYTGIRDNPFPPQPSGEDLTGKPLPKTN